MKLIERGEFLDTLHATFENLNRKEGRCVLITGEAGMGKTALTKAFCNELSQHCDVYSGSCDAFSTPNVLAPLFDISLQMKNEAIIRSCETGDCTGLFVKILKELSSADKPVVLVIEDIQWADRPTLDFIKFLARRIAAIPCMIILTCRDNEVPALHPLTNVLGQLSRNALTRISLPPLSVSAANEMAEATGYNGDDIYHLSGGNPFYVKEILSGNSQGVPDNIRDSILAVYNSQADKTRHMWDILSIPNAGMEILYLEKIVAGYAHAIKDALDAKILVLGEGRIFFKYELYRRTIEAALSPLVRIDLNKQILAVCIKEFELRGETMRILHHAKNAHRYDLVYRHALFAAKKAEQLEAYAEASKFYLLAIDCDYQTGDEQANRLYELYAYTCYLTGECQQGICYIERALNFWKGKQDPGKAVECTLLLSKLWRAEGKKLLAGELGGLAISMIEGSSLTVLKALAYENMAQLCLSAGKPAESLEWANRSYVTAVEIDNTKAIFQAGNSVGAALMALTTSFTKGKAILQNSLKMALKYGYSEHAASTYSILAGNSILVSDYVFAKRIINEGIDYCCERGLDATRLCLNAWKSRLCFETGDWDEAYRIADDLLQNDNLMPAVKISALTLAGTLKLRKGEPGALSLLLHAKAIAFDTVVYPEIIFLFATLLEYEWLNGQNHLDEQEIASVLKTATQKENINGINRLYYWLLKTQKYFSLFHQTAQHGLIPIAGTVLGAPVGGTYEHSIDLFEGSDNDKKKAVMLIQKLGAVAVYEKLKRQMRKAGIKNIPHGRRKVTLANPAFLTEREIDVLHLLKKGLLSKEIAESLFIASKTVGHHISAILTKLNVDSRGKAVQKAYSLNIIT